MALEGEYRTVSREASAEFTERRSRFIGHAAPVASGEEAAAFLRKIRMENREARHNVYAFSLRRGQTRRHSDDGEPQGTAGMPVLDVLLKSGVTDTEIVVTRYFGGILLGAGGLVRAYSRAASLALQAAGVATMRPCFLLETVCAYGLYSKIAALIGGFGGAVDRTGFTDLVRIDFHLECGKLPAFQAALSDATGGTCTAEITSEKFLP